LKVPVQAGVEKFAVLGASRAMQVRGGAESVQQFSHGWHGGDCDTAPTSQNVPANP
jgi:hypothetical protein